MEKVYEQINKIESMFDKSSQDYEKLGLLYLEIDNDDEAIKNLEKSIELNKNIGQGYKQLMSLYNKKENTMLKNIIAKGCNII